MSEYQYYEFQAVDRPLTPTEMAELRKLTTRATITPYRLQNVYHWGDFKGDPDELIERYFDAFVYVANWGTNWLMFRLPSGAIDFEQASCYVVEPSLKLRRHDELTIVEFRSEDEEGGWWIEDEEAEGWMPSLLPLRADLMQGDLRPLYVAWLAAIQPGLFGNGLAEVEEDEFEEYVEDSWIDPDTSEPPVPAGLGQPSAALIALGKFLRLDPDLLAVAAEKSNPQLLQRPSSEELGEWLRRVPELDKDDWLLRLLTGTGQQVTSEILRRYRHEQPGPASEPTASMPGRTAGELLSKARARAEARKRHEAEQRARARAAHLDSLVGREDAIWRQAEEHINQKQGRAYDEAVKLLVDLRDLAEREGADDAFAARLFELRLRPMAKVLFQDRLKQAGLFVK